MLLDTSSARLDLQHNQLTRLTDACGTRIDCVDGTAWVTIDGETRDIVLSRGDSFVVESRAPVIVHAIQGAATLALRARASDCPRPASSARPRSWRSLLASLAPSPASA